MTTPPSNPSRERAALGRRRRPHTQGSHADTPRDIRPLGFEDDIAVRERDGAIWLRVGTTPRFEPR